MAPYEKLKNLYDILIEAVNEESSKTHKDGREKLKSKGIEDASRFAIDLIKRSKDSLSEKAIISAFNSRVSSSIYSLIKYEDKYLMKNTDRYRDKIIYYQSYVEATQVIRDKVKRII